MTTKSTTSKPVKKATHLSPAKLAQAVKEKAFSLGAHLVGIAPISRMKNAPPELHPKRLLPEAKSLISMAYRINRGVQQVHLRGISPMSFSRFAGLEPKFRLDDMALDLANFLEDFDYVSLPIPANRPGTTQLKLKDIRGYLMVNLVALLACFPLFSSVTLTLRS